MKPLFHLGWINTFLSWPGFVPLSRISYIIYLMHFATINVLEGPVYYQKDASNTIMVCVKFINNDKIRQIGKLNPTFFYTDHVFSHCVVFYVNRICNHLCMHRMLAILWLLVLLVLGCSHCYRAW